MERIHAFLARLVMKTPRQPEPSRSEKIAYDYGVQDYRDGCTGNRFPSGRLNEMWKAGQEAERILESQW
jgi:hypothetical protein